MDLSEARRIYEHPKGHTKQECKDCIETLNATCQPVRLNALQFEALLDATKRLGKNLPLNIAKR